MKYAYFSKTYYHAKLPDSVLNSGSAVSLNWKMLILSPPQRFTTQLCLYCWR